MKKSGPSVYQLRVSVFCVQKVIWDNRTGCPKHKNSDITSIYHQSLIELSMILFNSHLFNNDMSLLFDSPQGVVTFFVGKPIWLST